jgi:tRNA(Ile)-lysidine synthetase-like protein
MSKIIPDLGLLWEALKPKLSESLQGVVVACSAGVDSTVLFHLLAGLAISQKKIRLAVTHVAYGLRGDESEGDFVFVRDLAERYGLEFLPRVITAEEREARRGEGVQEWARRLRRGHFKDLGDNGWVVALGHHLDDLAETAIFRMARGSSPGKLLGMQEWNAPFWRPLLSVSRSSILDYAVQQRIPYREDSSNAKLDYARNVIRHQVMSALSQLFPGAPSRIVACAQEAAELAASVSISQKFTDFKAPSMPPRPHENFDSCSAMRECEGLGLSRTSSFGIALRELCDLPRENARNKLASLIQVKTDGPRQLSRRWLDATLHRAKHGGRRGGTVADVPGGGTLFADTEGHLSFDPKARSLGQKTPRADQHARSLLGPDEDVLLEPGSKVFLTRSVSSNTTVVYRKIPDVTALYPVRYRVYGGAAATTFAFDGEKKSWALKDLLADWQIPMSERGRWRFFEADGSLQGMTDGRCVMRPGLKDAWIRDDQNIVEF